VIEHPKKGASRLKGGRTLLAGKKGGKRWKKRANLSQKTDVITWAMTTPVKSGKEEGE